MSALIKLLSFVTPAPPTPLGRDYSGVEYRWKMITFRPALFKFEGAALGLLGLYLLWYLVGRNINTSRAKAAVKPLIPYLSTQFTLLKPLVSSSPALHLLYATGRRNVLSLHTTISLLPLHDLAGLVVHLAKSVIDPTYDGSENILFDVTLGKGESGLQGEGVGVWAVVDKSAMRETKEKRWDLTFPRLVESAAVPITHAVFSEHSEATDALLKTANIGITELLADAPTASVLKYLLVTDVSARRPQKGPLPTQHKRRSIYLSVRKPSTEAQTAAVKAWLQVAMNIADLLAKPNVVKPEVTRKLVKTRQTVDTELGLSYKKALEEDLPAEETAEEKRAAKKRAERAQLSEKEQKRLDDLEKKREMRKAQKKQMK
ncbi:PAT complex subunit CCDC47, partial [Tremellales sp. Uapishka_1]